METRELKYILEELHFSSAFPSQVLDRLADASTTEQHAAGTVLFREGVENDKLYVVRSGRIALEMNVPGRGAVRLLTVGAGEMVGWSGLLEHGKMTATAIATENSEVIAAPGHRLREICRENHDFGFHFMRQLAGTLSKRLVATRLQLLDLFICTPQEIAVEKLEAP